MLFNHQDTLLKSQPGSNGGLTSTQSIKGTTLQSHLNTEKSFIILQLVRAVVPSAVISLTILGLAAIYTGSCVDAQAGEGNRLRVMGSEAVCGGE